ncbi:MAG: biotin--[acetyl-CoA-carboxylase] ligase [Gammaproteobacteria bacterium]|nr:biotin--[acetyl-CoA-carboxylase] ligase [Gammaproteobacteria bacterium]
MLGALDPALLRQITLLEIHDSLPSTNGRLLQVPATPTAGSLAVCLAGHQSAGRGRNGKSWHAPDGAGLLLSVSRSAPKAPDGSLALALGVAIAEGLETFVSDTVELKWPNDLVAQDRKLGGILVEASTQGNLGGRASRPPQGGTESRVVAGLGINIRVSEEQHELVAGEGGMHPAGLSELNQRKAPEPNALAAAMITAIAGVLETHPVDGFNRWKDDWNARDWLAGKRIEARSGADTHLGTAAGVDSSGALLLDESGATRRIVSAEIRL